MDGKRFFGKHWMRLEGDTLFCKYVGVITLQDVQESMQVLAQEYIPGQTYYIIADVAEMTGMEAAARKVSTAWFARHNIGGVVNFGVGPLARAISELILSLLRLLHKSSMPVHFVKTEAEARAWVQEQRQRAAAAVVQDKASKPS
jgi:hypothetical protein